MGIKKFIDSVQDFLGLDDFGEQGKKKSIKSLLKKLEKREKDIKKKLDKNTNKDEKSQLKEELEIVSVQIKKGKKYLEKLEN